MLKNYFTTALRSLKKQRFYSLLNIAGLTISFFSTLVLSMYIWHEYSFDSFHENKEDIYRLWEENSGRQFSVTPYAWRDPMLDEFPFIEDIVRVQTLATIFKANEKLFSEPNGIVVDTSFFNIFSFELLEGDKKSALGNPKNILLTPTLAEKYFGGADPIGQLIDINLFGNKESFSVSGIIDCPANSHLQFEYVLPFERVLANNPNKIAYDNWSVHFLYTYLLIREEVDYAEAKVAFNEFLHRHHGDWLSAKYNPQLEPLSDIYLRSTKEFELQPKGSESDLRTLAAVVLTILLIGIINFINLTTARAFTRSKNSSIRQVFGSSKLQLIFHFLLEAYMVLFASIILALVLMEVLHEPIETLCGKDLRPSAWLSFSFVSIITVLWLVLGFIVSLYPGWVTASVKPIELLRTKSQQSHEQVLGRKILSIFQIGSSAILIVGTAVMWYQIDFMSNKSLGYNKEQLLIINDGGLVASDADKLESFKNRLQNKAYFKEISALSSYPGTPSHWRSRYFLEGDDESSSMSLATFFSDFNFVKTLDLEIVEGRNFDTGRPNDSINFIVNQACIDFFAEKDSLWATDPFSQTLDWRYNKQKGKVVGIVKDFHFESLKNEISPVIITEHLPFTSFIGLKIASNDFNQVIEDLESQWVSMYPNVPFSYSFADETFDQTFQSELRIGKLFIIFASLSIFIAMLGLFGLAASTAHEKAKEIGIRKVIGASKRNIVQMLLRQFVSIVLIANALAIPISYWLSSSWLEDFSYRIDWPIHVIFVSVGLTLVITLGTILAHAIKISMINPVDVLSNE